MTSPSNFLVSPFKEYWQFFIKKIERKDIFVSTLSDFTKWLQNKKDIKVLVNSTKSKMVINIKKPRTIKSFSFEISHKGELEQIETAKIQKLAERKYRCESQKTNITLTYILN